MKDRIGFIGLGLMGSAMARRLLHTSYSLTVYNRSREKAEPLGKLGAAIADSPGSAAREAGVIFSMVSTSEVLREGALGRDGVLNGLKEDAIHVDCSTVSPSLTRELEDRYAESGRVFVHCPVLGSVPQATEGSLLLLAGGRQSALSKCEEVLTVLGKRLWKFERAPQASYAKLLCNSFIAGMITTLTQAIVFAQRVDVEPAVLLEVIGNSALNAPTYQTKGRSILARDFTPRFYTEHMLKDVNLMIESAKENGIHVPGVEVAQQLLEQAVALGFGKEDYSSIIKVLEDPQRTDHSTK